MDPKALSFLTTLHFTALIFLFFQTQVLTFKSKTHFKHIMQLVIQAFIFFIFFLRREENPSFQTSNIK